MYNVLNLLAVSAIFRFEEYYLMLAPNLKTVFVSECEMEYATENFMFSKKIDGITYCIFNVDCQFRFSEIMDQKFRDIAEMLYMQYSKQQTEQQETKLYSEVLANLFKDKISSRFSMSEQENFVRILKYEAKMIAVLPKGNWKRQILLELLSNNGKRRYKAFASLGFEKDMSNYYKDLMIGESFFAELVHKYLFDEIRCMFSKFEYPEESEFVDNQTPHSLSTPYYLSFNSAETEFESFATYIVQATLGEAVDALCCRGIRVDEIKYMINMISYAQKYYILICDSGEYIFRQLYQNNLDTKTIRDFFLSLEQLKRIFYPALKAG